MVGLFPLSSHNKDAETIYLNFSSTFEIFHLAKVTITVRSSSSSLSGNFSTDLTSYKKLSMFDNPVICQERTNSPREGSYVSNAKTL